MVLHSICRGVRFHTGEAISNKEEETLINGVFTIWVKHFGPMKELYFDGEGGLNTPRAQAQLRRHGIEPKPRAPGQHIRLIDRRSALVRVTMHTTEEQAKREGLEISFDVLWASSVFAGNALITVGDSTPYQAVFGRQPGMLPALEMPDYPEGESADGRKEARVREISIGNFAQATALQKVVRASQSKSSASGQGLYAPGDLIDYFRPTKSKDSSGWRGPILV